MRVHRRHLSYLVLAAATYPQAAPPQPAATVRVSPAWVALLPGDSIQLTVTGPDNPGDPSRSPPPVTWGSSNPAVARISEGRVQAAAFGVTSIRARVGDLEGIATVVVAPPVLVGAGDIGRCRDQDDEATAALLDTIQGVVFTAGDNAYPDGTAADFRNCYHPGWGRHRERTRPSPGNHDYRTRKGAPYYAYFGAAAGDPGVGYYSFDFAQWHIVSLNSNVSMEAGSRQEQWLRQDLAAHPARCTVAYWHHPRFSSASHGSDTEPQPLWQALYDAGADVIIVGHDHSYERFAPQTPTGRPDPARGIRQFVAGTGGASLYDFPTIEPNSEIRNNTTHGVLKLTLRPDGYDWRFVPVAGKTFSDSGSGSCH
jgi:acid phosphatase type 7